MKSFIPFVPFYVAVVPIFVYIVNHEKKHSRFVVYLKLICDKLGIRCEEKE